MEYNNVVFYNHYGNGDLWVSREFIKQLMDIFLGSHYYYAHAQDHHLFFDIPELEYKSLDENCNMREPYIICGDTLYVNTWIGYAYGKYVFPGVTVSLNNYKRLFNDLLSLLDINYRFTGHIKDYVPEPDFTMLPDLYYENINKFIYDNVNKNIMLISNGNVQSNQAPNFDFSAYIDELALSNPDGLFLVTEDYNTKAKNVLYTKDIIGKQKGSDLPEIGYLSTFVNAIVGRSSGPYVFAQNIYNYNNSDIYILGFSYEKACAHMLEQKDSSAILEWCGTSNSEDISRELDKAFKWGEND